MKNSAELKTSLSPINKTLKLFIDGEFPRTESGRSYQVKRKSSAEIYANLCLASRKDLRTAVESSKKAQASWSSRSAYNRSQILYRIAEMMEGKRDDLHHIASAIFGLSESDCEKMSDEIISVFVYYGGFADKYEALLGSSNPVGHPFQNTTVCDAVGVVGVLADQETSLLDICTTIAATICSGNTVVVMLSGGLGSYISWLGEVFATSDVPKGVINLLSGSFDELVMQFATHMEINALAYLAKDQTAYHKVLEGSVGNLKRVSQLSKNSEPKSLENISRFLEFKTMWVTRGF